MMTHVLVLAEGKKEHIQNGVDAFEKLVYEDPRDKTKSGVHARELRLYSFTVKENAKKEFLSNLKQYTINLEVEPLHKGDSQHTSKLLAHGVDGKGFRYGLFRKMLEAALGMLNARPIKMGEVVQKDNQVLIDHFNKNPYRPQFLVIGELPDGVEENGRENS